MCQINRWNLIYRVFHWSFLRFYESSARLVSEEEVPLGYSSFKLINHLASADYFSPSGIHQKGLTAKIDWMVPQAFRPRIRYAKVSYSHCWAITC